MTWRRHGSRWFLVLTRFVTVATLGLMKQLARADADSPALPYSDTFTDSGLPSAWTRKLPFC